MGRNSHLFILLLFRRQRMLSYHAHNTDDNISSKLHFLLCPGKFEEQSHCYCLSFYLFLLRAEPELLLKTTYS